jgi:predicted N-acetyltransferase YhbS
MSTSQKKSINAPEVTIRPLQERELETADRIFRVAFGTFLGMPNPEAFAGDSDAVRTRWKADPTRVFAAEVDGELVGSNVASNWGSVGFFGPLTIRPDLWDRGIGKLLMEPIMEKFSEWGTRHAGLFTFPHSPKHLYLYQKYGFYPRFLTALLSKPVTASASASNRSTLSEVSKSEQAAVLQACREVTEAIYEGLDVRGEIQAVQEQRLGETVLLWNGSHLVGFACCHCGAGTEAGTGTCYIKFGAVLPGPGAAERFDQLLRVCEAEALSKGLSHLMAGVNLGREEAYRQLLASGFRAAMMGIAMERPNESGYNHSGVYLIDDWR